MSLKVIGALLVSIDVVKICVVYEVSDVSKASTELGDSDLRPSVHEVSTYVASRLALPEVEPQYAVV